MCIRDRTGSVCSLSPFPRAKGGCRSWVAGWAYWARISWPARFTFLRTSSSFSARRVTSKSDVWLLVWQWAPIFSFPQRPISPSILSSSCGILTSPPCSYCWWRPCRAHCTNALAAFIFGSFTARRPYWILHCRSNHPRSRHIHSLSLFKSPFIRTITRISLLWPIVRPSPASVSWSFW